MDMDKNMNIKMDKDMKLGDRYIEENGYRHGYDMNKDKGIYT